MKHRQVADARVARKIHDTCLCLHVMRAARAVGRRYDALLRPVGLNGWQFSLLMALNRDDPPSMGALAKDLVMDRTTLTANLKPLEKRGLVSISADESDARVRVLSLTKAGQKLLAEALPLWRRAQSETGALLDPETLDGLRADLRRLEA